MLIDMPLFKGKANIGRNIKTLLDEGRPRDQSIAIAENVAGNARPKAKAKGRRGKSNG